MEGSDSNPSLCPLTVCGCAIRRRASQSNSQLKSRMERIPLSATHKSTLTQESLRGGVPPLARWIWGFRPPDPGFDLTSKIRSPQVHVAYRFAWNRSYPVGVASPSGDTDVKLVIASRSPYLNRPIPTSGNQCSIEWVKNNRFDGTLMRLETID